MDRDYRVTAKANGVTIQKVEGDDLAEFRIESARFRSSGYLITVAIVSVFGYGWALDTKVVRRPPSPNLRREYIHANSNSALRRPSGPAIFHWRLNNRSL